MLKPFLCKQKLQQNLIVGVATGTDLINLVMAAAHLMAAIIELSYTALPG